MVNGHSRAEARRIRRDIYGLILPSVLQNILEIGVGVLTTAIIGRLLADRLLALGAEVTVSARKYGDLAWIEASASGSSSLTGRCSADSGPVRC